MPGNYAKIIAKQFIDGGEDGVELDLLDGPFADKVAVELQNMGLIVERDRFREG